MSHNFSEQLRKYRGYIGYSQQELANRVGVGRTTIDNWENDRNMPGNRELVLRLAQELCLYPQDLEKTNALLQAAGYASQRLIGEDDYLPNLSDLDELSQQSQTMGELYGVISLPHYFLPRDDDLSGLKAKVLALPIPPIVDQPHSPPVGIHGMVGCGKTVLAAALVRDREIRQAFPDGIHWLTLGQTPNLTIRQAQLAQAFKEPLLIFEDAQQGKVYLERLLLRKTCLIVLDDVWNIAHADAFNVVETPSKLLLTTRNATLLRTLNAEEHHLGILTEDTAITLLAQTAKVNRERLTANKDAKQIAAECGHLPLALAMIGTLVRKDIDRNQTDPWKRALYRLRSKGLANIRHQFPDYAYSTLLRAIDVSVKALAEDESLAQSKAQDRYFDLVVFPKNSPISLDILFVFWAGVGLDHIDVEDLVSAFLDRGLMQRSSNNQLMLHDLQEDYVQQQATEIKARHKRLLDSYTIQWESLLADLSLPDLVHLREIFIPLLTYTFHELPFIQHLESETIKVARQTGDTVTLAHFLVATGHSLHRQGYHQKAINSFEEATQLYNELNEPLQALRSHFMTSLCRRALGHGKRASQILEDVLKQLSPDDPWRVNPLQVLAWVAQDSGKLEDAERFLREALNFCRQNERSNILEARLLADLGEVLGLQGRPLEAQTLFQESLSILSYLATLNWYKLPYIYLKVRVKWKYAELHLSQNKFAQALGELDQADSLLKPYEYHHDLRRRITLTRALIYWRQLHFTVAISVLRSAYNYHRELGLSFGTFIRQLIDTFLRWWRS